MGSDIIINANEFETRVALLEGRQVSEISVDRIKDRGVTGNIYKGKVVRVLPGMQAAFVEIGQERAAFLHASDIVLDMGEYAEMLTGDEINGDDEFPMMTSSVTRSLYLSRSADHTVLEYFGPSPDGASR